MKQLKDWFVPWLLTAREYNTAILDKAWAKPDYGRMMLNENPIPPSEKVIKAVTDILSKGNRYPDSMLRLRTQTGEAPQSGTGQHRSLQRILGDHRLHDADLPSARR